MIIFSLIGYNLLSKAERIRARLSEWREPYHNRCCNCNWRDTRHSMRRYDRMVSRCRKCGHKQFFTTYGKGPKPKVKD